MLPTEGMGTLATHLRPIGLAPPNGGGLRSRIGPGALIVLVHIAVTIALIRYAGTPSVRDNPASTVEIVSTIIPIMATPLAQAVVAHAPASSLRPRRAAAHRVRPAPPAPVPIPASRAPEAPSPVSEGQPAPPQNFDMEGWRNAARQLESERVPTARQHLREADDSTLARDIKKANRPNCQSAYAGGKKANLLVLIPLAIDTVTGKGCKW
ncbi:hypothetical protein [Massilia sp. H6]|uniref:hypothetical protein n=1 Tax=Massilia sp. H6 TaxID=2970464 RepID=UPI002166FA49|nr:hypothetical protein [Massilia sp. H6]UVW29070.1 hypothetical protein NRS07_02690 [Massilia sp. H6]